MSLGGEVGEEGRNLLMPQLGGVAQAVEADISLDSEGVSQFGAAAIAAQMHELARPLE